MPEDPVTKHTELVLSVTDKATGPLGAIAANIDRVSGKFDALSSHVSTIATAGASLLGAFGFERLIDAATEHFSAIKRITTITGLAVEKADAMSEAFESAGVPLEVLEQGLMRLSRQGQRFNMAMQGMGGGPGAGVSRVAAMLPGVTMKDPERAFMQISSLMKRGKLDAVGLGMALGIGTDSALKLATFLKQGPQHLHQAIEEAKKLAITTEQMQQFTAYKAAKNELSASLHRASIIVGAELFPLLTKMLRYTADHVKEWVHHAQAFGRMMHMWLSKNLDTAIALSKVLIANAALQKVTGAGVIGMGRRLVGFAQGRVGVMGLLGREGGVPGAGAAGNLAMSGVRMLAAGVSAGLKGGRGLLGSISGDAIKQLTLRATGGLGLTGRGLGELAQRGLWGALKLPTMAVRAVPGAARAVGEGALGLITKIPAAFAAARPFIMGMLRLTALGAVIGILVAGIMAIVNNVDGVRTRLLEVWTGITDKFATFIKAIGPVGTMLSTVGGVLKDIFQLTLPFLLDALGGFLGWLISLATRIALFTKEIVTEGGWRHPMETWAKAGEAASKLELETTRSREKARMDAEIAAKRAVLRGAPAERGGVNMDFRGSRFEISQGFAEGFDPDRVAVAFTGGLATLGERKVQSAGFSPLFAVR